MGFLDSLAKSAALWGAVQASKDENGKPDPYKAAGIAAGTGNFSPRDRARLGAMLKSQGAFDSDDSYSYSSYGGGSSYDDTDDDWKLFCEDGFEYGVDPDDYDSEEEYMEALTEAKYAWRDDCEDGFEHGIDAEDYETAEEYEEALAEAKYGWRDDCEDGFEHGIDPEDYETAEEYEEALTEAKYSWREDCEDGFDYDVDPENYETEEEYNEALELAKNESEEIVEVTETEVFSDENVEEIIDSDEPIEEAVVETDTIIETVEAQVSDTVSVPITLQVSIPKRDTTKTPVNSYAARREQYLWRKSYRRQEIYGLNVYDFETERDFLWALESAREEFLEVAKNDKTIYYYCAVVYEDGPYPYHYRTEDTALKIGDKVVVPVGRQNTERIATVVSVEQHSRLTVPYPVEKTKFIIRKYEE